MQEITVIVRAVKEKDERTFCAGRAYLAAVKLPIESHSPHHYCPSVGDPVPALREESSSDHPSDAVGGNKKKTRLIGLLATFISNPIIINLT